VRKDEHLPQTTWMPAPPAPKGEGTAIGSYDYISCEETSEKIGCSIGSARVGAGAAFSGNVVTVKFRGSKGE